MKCSECDCVMDLCKDVNFKHCKRCTKQTCCCDTLHKPYKQKSILTFFHYTKSFFATALGIEIVGQYLGIRLLVVIGALGSLLALVILQQIIGLLGFVPISIGIIRLLQLRKRSSVQEHMNGQVTSRWHNHLSMLTVAAVTFSNGGDNIGIYTPLFANIYWNINNCCDFEKKISC